MELKKISPEEVTRHTSAKDCWVVIHGKVYDVSQFLSDHPGGEDMLLHASSSGDATQSFEDVGHSSSAKKRMSNYLIGELDGYDPFKAKIIRRKSDAVIAAELQKMSFGIKDYALPLTLLFIAIAAWIFDKKPSPEL
ncbi:uncharacterized protein LOC144705788 [Wolffia australiana]